ncbi:MAG: hypothetical protein WBA44_09590 [Mesorhizobium sp.]
MTQTGTIMEWSNGFGYLNADDEPDPGRWSAFVHADDLRAAGIPAELGARLTYDVEPTSRHRPRAIPLRAA